MAVLIVPTTQPEPIETYSIRVAEAWKIGRKGQDNGVVFLVAKNDRKMRLEVGYGLEGVLTDVTARRIIAENIAPLFRQNQYAAGIKAGVDRVIAVVGRASRCLPAKPVAKQRQGHGRIRLRDAADRAARRRSGRRRNPVARSSARCWAPGSAVGVVGADRVVGRRLARWSPRSPALIGFFVMLVFSGVGGIGRRGGGWVPIPGGGGGSWGGGGFGGGGGFSGGGGSFGGGGASGGW